MGIHVKRIEKEFMLKTLLDRDIPVIVHGDRKQAGFFITQYSDSEIFLRPKDNPVVEFIKNEAVRLFGSIDTTYVTLSSTVLRRDDKSLIIENTDNFCKNPERKYERINTKNMKVSFKLKGNTIELNFPKTDTFAIIEEPPKSDLFDATSIADLIKSFKEHLGKISTNNTIVMFREKPPSTPEENLITRIGKILWIPDTKGELPGENSPLSQLVISQNEFTRFFESTGVAQDLVHSEIASLLYKKHKNNIVAEIYCPILYHEYAIGYIHAANDKPADKAFGIDLIHYTYQFSKVLSYSLEKHGYFKQKSGGAVNYQEPIIDISGSGLLFATQSQDIDNKLTMLDDMDIMVTINEKKIVIGSRVMRKFKDLSTFYFAVQFLRISDADFRFLFEYLYGKIFTKKDEVSWEGGSPPPPV